MNKISHQKLALIIIDGITKKKQYNQTKSNVTVSLYNYIIGGKIKISHYDVMQLIFVEWKQ